MNLVQDKVMYALTNFHVMKIVSTRLIVIVRCNELILVVAPSLSDTKCFPFPSLPTSSAYFPGLSGKFGQAPTDVCGLR